jgi:hypothetical protein
MASKVMVNCLIKFKTDVYVKGDDMIKSLYFDLSQETNSEVKKYIQASIDVWEEYMEEMRNNASNRH